MIVKRNAEHQATVDVDALVHGRNLIKRYKNEMPTFLPAFNYQEIQKHVDSPPFPVIFRDLLHFRQEHGRFVVQNEKRSTFPKYDTVIGAMQNSFPYFTIWGSFLVLVHLALQAIKSFIS